MPVTHEPGDAALPDPGGRATIIAHVVNDAGAWGRGFVVALGRRYPYARMTYERHWCDHELGDVQWVNVGDYINVANMFAQRGVIGPQPRVRYGPLRKCLKAVFYSALTFGAVVHMPRVGCGLGGGSWRVVKTIIEETAEAEGADVVVFSGEGATR